MGKPKANTVDNTRFTGFVVAIGASAGGLDALEQLFKHLDANTGAAFVVIQHLSPDHKSMMDNLLARHTSMPICVAEHRMRLQPNHVFLLPPGKTMTLEHDMLMLEDKPPYGLSLPIDIFFTSLSEVFERFAVAIVLSGTGSDGTRGSVAINAQGGLLLAQLPEDAKFDGMPRSVIATGLVDDKLTAAGIAERLNQYIAGKRDHTPIKLPALQESDERANALEKLMHVLHQSSGINFREYKLATVLRRVERRMQFKHIHEMDAYVDLLRQDKAEAISFRRELLIPVTSFFRDPESFERLGTEVIEQLVIQHSEAVPLRIWCAACATGEEAYTLAILLLEAMERTKHWPNIKIFATDAEQHYLDVASAGVYSEAILTEMSKERIERFFIHKNGHYLVKPELRQQIVFAKHNLLEDPPFTRMSLVTCRNALIYFLPIAQERALRRMQYALLPGGYLFLGSSESLGPLESDFSTVDARHKLFRIERPVNTPLVLGTRGIARNGSNAAISPIRSLSRQQHAENELIEAAQATMLNAYTPPSMLVGENRELIHLFGQFDQLLRFREGHVSLDVVRLLGDQLGPVVLVLLHKSQLDNSELRSEPIKIADPSGKVQLIRVVARPVKNPGSSLRQTLVSFEAAQAAVLVPDGPFVDVAAEAHARSEVLEHVLAATRDSLQATIEELETANEELQATNEELMSSNEELQSTNEELQSVNEELHTVNAEHQEKILQLNKANSDLDGLTRASMIPTLFLAEDLTLARFTPEACRLFSLRETDVGRPITDFNSRLDYPGFIADLYLTLSTGHVTTREVGAADGEWYYVRILPHSVPGSSLRRLVVTFFDIGALRDKRYLQAILDSLPEHIAVLDRSGVITQVNLAWRNFAFENGDPELAYTGPGKNYLDACKASSIDDKDVMNARTGLEQVLAGKIGSFTQTYPCHSATEKRWFMMHVGPIHTGEGGAVISHINVTTWFDEEKPNGIPLDQ